VAPQGRGSMMNKTRGQRSSGSAVGAGGDVTVWPRFEHQQLDLEVGWVRARGEGR